MKERWRTLRHIQEIMNSEKALAPLGKEMEIGIVKILNSNTRGRRGLVMNHTEMPRVIQMNLGTILKFLFFSQKSPYKGLFLKEFFSTSC